jgi:hypothetical protein
MVGRRGHSSALHYAPSTGRDVSRVRMFVPCPCANATRHTTYSELAISSGPPRVPLNHSTSRVTAVLCGRAPEFEARCRLPGRPFITSRLAFFSPPAASGAHCSSVSCSQTTAAAQPSKGLRSAAKKCRATRYANFRWLSRMFCEFETARLLSSPPPQTVCVAASCVPCICVARRHLTRRRRSSGSTLRSPESSMR